MSATTTIPLKLIEEREKSYHVESPDGLKAYLPKSQCNWERFNPNKMEGELTIPDWLIEKINWQ